MNQIHDASKDVVKSLNSTDCIKMLSSALIVLALACLIYWNAPKICLDIQPIYDNEENTQNTNNINRINWENATLKFVNVFAGPVSFTRNPASGDIFTGTSDGMLWIINNNLTDAEPLIRIGDNHAKCGHKDMERFCGRILSLKYLLDDKIIVTDAYKGIIAVHIRKHVKQTLIRPDQNMLTRSLKIFNSVDVSSNGIVYFTVSSMKWELNDVLYSILEHESTGRVYSYNLMTRQINILATNVSFASGLTLTHDEKSLIFCEFNKRKLHKINLESPDEIPTVFLENISGYPGNIKKDNSGNYYLTVSLTNCMGWLQFLHRHPFLKYYMAWLLPKWLVQRIFYCDSQAYKINNEGTVSNIFQGKISETETITEAFEVDNKLYLGNMDSPHFNVFELTKSNQE